MFDQFTAHIVCTKCNGSHEGKPWELQFKCFGRNCDNISEGDDVRRLANPPLRDDRYEDYMTCPHCGHEDDVDLVFRDYIFIGARPITPKTYLVRFVEDVWYKMNKKKHLREHETNVNKRWLAKLKEWGYDPDIHALKGCMHNSCL